MARYTGPKRKLERREKQSLFGTNKWEKRPGNPGQHPVSRGRLSGYATQKRETQKLKRIYGVLEKQFSNVVKKALKSEGNSGTRLLQLLELRLDNVVYRMNLAKTRMQARQFVTHGHIKVNGAKVNIPSYLVKEGDEVTIDGQLLEFVVIDEKRENKSAWLEIGKGAGKIVSIPQRAELEQSVNERLIIEFYSR